MYICPVCKKPYEKIQKHFLSCWKEQHPFHQSNPAPHSEDTIVREVDNNVMAFFEGLK